MRIAQFDYLLPKSRIAQQPIKPRDHSRLLVLHRKAKAIEHKHFYDLPRYLHRGDVLVLNDTKVFRARCIGKKETGGKIEVFLLHPISSHRWEVLLGGRGRHENMKVTFGRAIYCVIEKHKRDSWIVRFNVSSSRLMKVLGTIGTTPTPPYIKVRASQKDYQTVYANSRKIGSVAAPTAGFHFTPKLLTQLKTMGVRIAFVTLHVGLGTFAPVKVDDITKHVMHAEYAEVNRSTMTTLRKAKQDGKRIVAVGTTSVRVLETVFSKRRPLKEFHGWIATFIYPGYRFRMVQGMITNFHLPKSTLLMLVSAFAGTKPIQRAYRIAVQRRYRFYSFGDAMLIV